METIITRKQAEALLAARPGDGWTVRPAPKPITLGEYGYADEYRYRGAPVLRLEVGFNPPRCTAYDLTRAQASAKV